jgi:hypothetical protein
MIGCNTLDTAQLKILIQGVFSVRQYQGYYSLALVFSAIKQ